MTLESTDTSKMTSSKRGTSHSGQLNHLKRIEGQVRGVSRMIEEKRYCLDILQQIKAIKSSLGTIEQKIIQNHLDHCVHKAVSSKNTLETQEVIDEIKDVIKAIKS